MSADEATTGGHGDGAARAAAGRDTSTTPHRGELDALRAGVVVGLVLFHSALVFDTRDDFYVKNDVTVDLTGVAAGFVVVWAMPLLFAVAGLAAAHSVRRRGPGGFVRERLLRLGVPLVAATVLLVPVPQWLRARAAGHPDGALPYPQFWRRFFDVHLDLGQFPFVVAGRWFETGHLWFVVLLLVGSLVVAAFAAWPGWARWADDARGWVAARPAAVLLPAVAIGAASAAELEEGFAAGNRWAYVLTFVAGFWLLADERVRAAVRRDTGRAFLAGGVAFAAAGAVLLTVEDVFVAPSPVAALGRVAWGAAGWCLVVAILGRLDRGAPTGGVGAGGARAASGPWWRRVLARYGDLVMPFYVLHQPVVVVVAYLVVRTDLPAVVKFVAIVVASLVATSALAVAARLTPVTRLLLGVRVRRGAA
jgi:glucan biosynthesis protein C